MPKYEFKTTPYDFQREALTMGWNRPFFAYLMDRGTGKTKVTIDNAGVLFTQGLIQAMLIIAPNEVHERWISEQLPIHLPDTIKHNARVWNNSRAKTKRGKAELETLFEKTPGVLQILSMNVESFQIGKGKNLAYNFCRQHQTMLVVDESTRIKTHNSNRTKAIMKLRDMVPYRRILTGNEVTNSPFDVYSQFEFLSSGFWGNRNYFWFTHHFAKYENQFVSIKNTKNTVQCPECRETGKLKVSRFYNQSTAKWQHYFACLACSERLTWTPFKEKGGRLHYFLHKAGSKNKQEVKSTDLIREVRTINENHGFREYPKLIEYRNLAELRDRIQPHIFRVLKKDCLDIPEKIYSPLYCEMNEEQSRIYAEFRDDLYSVYNDHELTVKNKISLMIRFRQVVGGFFPESNKLIGKSNPKMDRLLYDLEDVDETAVIVWSVFTAELEYIARTLKAKYTDKTVALYYGATPKDKRREILDQFQAGLIDFFVGNPATAGTGLNLQQSTLHYYFSDSFKLEDRWQSEDRSHRHGQHWPVVYKDLYIRDTVDDTIKKSRDDKTEIADFFKEYKIEELV